MRRGRDKSQRWRPRGIINGEVGERLTEQVLSKLVEMGLIMDWEKTDKKDDKRGIDYIVRTDDGRCFIDSKSYDLRGLISRISNQRIDKGVRTSSAVNKFGLLILYYKPSQKRIKEDIEGEAKYLMSGIRKHLKKLSEKSCMTGAL